MSGISGADIEKIISGVKRAVRAAQQSDGGTQKLTIDKLELILKGLVEKNVGGELKIKIPVIDTGFGAKADVTSKELHVWDDVYREFGKIVGKEPLIRHLPSELLMKADPNLFGHLYLEKSYATVFDNSKIRRDVPDFKAEISLSRGIRIIYDWYEKESHAVDPVKDALEDSLVSFYDRCAEEIVKTVQP